MHEIRKTAISNQNLVFCSTIPSLLTGTESEKEVQYCLPQVPLGKKNVTDYEKASKKTLPMKEMEVAKFNNANASRNKSATHCFEH